MRFHRDTPEDCLREAQMHIECINDAWLEFTDAFKQTSDERKEVVRDEISTRIWAVIYLIQYRGDPEAINRQEVQEILREANAHNGIDDEDGGEATSLH